jgi:pyridoxal phosphate enzyme (YggS family)
MGKIAEALEQVRQRIDAAASRAGRDASQITLVAVSKTRSVEEILEAVGAGAVDLGENYVQELVAKREELERRQVPVRWHFIGHLQRNKAKFLTPFCHLIHAVDDLELARELDRRAAQHDRKQAVLLEVNIAGEQTKFGVAPEEAAALAEGVAALPNLQLRGLMAMTPLGASADEAARLYAQVRELAEQLGRNLPPGSMGELSMGMTQDFEVAVEQGATLVRIGTAIFGPRPPRA